ncbi:MAG: T9SS type A sorting domain-containing protein [Bacteroidia bacterium]
MKNLFCLLLIIYTTTANANVIAGDISYIKTAGNYSIYIRTYTTTTNSTDDHCDLVVSFGDGNNGVATRINGTSNLCIGADGVFFGTCASTGKYSIYEVTHSYSTSGTYLVTVEIPNRMEGICNIPNSTDQSFFLRAELVVDSLWGSNNEAFQFAGAPIKCDTVGVMSTYLPELYLNIAPGDSYSYELITPFANGGVPIGGYALPTFTTAFSLDSTTGVVTWNTPIEPCLYTFNIKITKWREYNGTVYKIASIMQDVFSSVISQTGISNLSVSKLELYPNPTTNQITIVFGKVTSEVLIEIKNLLGETLYSEFHKKYSGGIIDISALPNGVYCIQVQNECKTLTKKIIKQ